MVFENNKKILILAPHPDDAEFGLGGTIAKMLDQGKEIFLVVFSLCEKSTPPGFEIGSIEKELYISCDFLGIKRENINVLNFLVRDFPENRQKILEELIKIKNQIKPDMVFLPSSSDIHQDHKTVHDEGVRAFKHCSVLGYEMPWNNFGFTSYVYIKLEEKYLNKKIDALKKYKTQEHRAYSSERFVTSLATLRGAQILEEYAESFEAIRIIER